MMVMFSVAITGASVVATPAYLNSCFRKWVDSTGKFEVEAKLVELIAGKIVLTSVGKHDAQLCRVPPKVVFSTQLVSDNGNSI